MAPAKIPWLTNLDLFLHSQGGIVEVWKCKLERTISKTLLMNRSDFEYVDDVQNRHDLIESGFNWAETDYKELVKYISERGLLVNGEGLVVAALPKYNPNGRIDQTVSPVYMWSFNILDLDTYIHGVRSQGAEDGLTVKTDEADAVERWNEELMHMMDQHY